MQSTWTLSEVVCATSSTSGFKAFGSVGGLLPSSTTVHSTSPLRSLPLEALWPIWWRLCNTLAIGLLALLLTSVYSSWHRQNWRNSKARKLQQLCKSLVVAIFLHLARFSGVQVPFAREISAVVVMWSAQTTHNYWAWQQDWVNTAALYAACNELDDENAIVAEILHPKSVMLS